MAEGWARVTGQPGVAIATAGPGVTNTITGLWNAYECAAPLIMLGGRNFLSEYDMGSPQELDSIALVNSVTKWSKTCYEINRIPEYVSMAFRQAMGGRPGPVYLEVPWDVLQSQIEESEVTIPVNYRTTARPYGDQEMVKKAVDLLLKAERPIVIAGSGVWWSRAEKELLEFIEMMKLPLTLIQMGRGAVPEDHPLCFGPTRVGTREADAVLLIGTRLNYGLNFGRPGLFNDTAKWIQIDIEATEIGHNRPIDIGIVGDARSILQQMIDEAKDRCKDRPELPWLVDKYEPWQRKRFAVPQGITGWWQVNGRSDNAMHLHTDQDLYYIQNYSLWLDMRILWRTVAVVVRGKGAY